MFYTILLTIFIASLLAIAILVAIFFIKRKLKRNKRRGAYAKDTVILHQFSRGIHAPSASPFVLKLETWLRMSGIKYKNEYDNFGFSKKGQMPWITFNGEDVFDSQFCIEYLKKKLDIDLNKNLSTEQQGAARAFFKLTEESLKWQVAFRRFLFNRDSTEYGIPWIVLWLFKGKVQNAGWLQGYGRHSKEEIIQIGKDDLKAINDYIGGKTYLMGDEVCDTDACLFGMLSQFVFHDKGPLNSYIKSDCQNILRYVNTIKDTYWKDWDQCLRKQK